MAPKNPFPFGEPNFETAARWLSLTPDTDGAVWMVNLMKYREVADYGDGESRGVSGKEADDAYAPLGPLAAVGAIVALHGDVEAQTSGDPAWDRIGIVRYPTRASFFQMQERTDFKQQYTHKKAGMEFTIVAGCLPNFVTDASTVPGSDYVMRVRRFAADTEVGEDPDGVIPVAVFDVDGVILGDARTWDEVRFDLADDAAMAAMLDVTGVEEQVVMRVHRAIDNIVESIHTAPGA